MKKIMKRVPITNAQIAAARKKGAQEATDPLRAIEAEYDGIDRTMRLRLRCGVLLAIPVSEIPEIAHASSAKLKDLSLTPGGDALLWESLDSHISIEGLLYELFAHASHAELGRRGGRVTSAKKRDAVRRNGAKGGRPRSKVA